MLDLFHGDFFDRFLTRLGLPASSTPGVAKRALGLWIVAFVPLLLAASLEGNLIRMVDGRVVARLSMLADVPVWTQIFSWLWARTEISSDLATWTSAIAEPGRLAWFSGFLDRREWIPVAGYGALAPTVFLAPLFMFTSQLRRTKDAARARLQPLVVEVAETFRDQWLTRGEARAEDLLHAAHTSHLADLHAAHHAVKEMRVVPFDRRSVVELFSAAAIPLGVLLFYLELPTKVRALIELFG